MPQSILLLLLLALCGLCAWQWHRENELRILTSRQLREITTISAQRDELEARVKAADAEILRLTGSLADMRTNSVSKTIHEELAAANTTMREGIDRQNTAIKEMNEMIARGNDATRQANERIKALATERDTLVSRLNEITAKYNELAKKGSG